MDAEGSVGAVPRSKRLAAIGSYTGLAFALAPSNVVAIDAFGEVEYLNLLFRGFSFGQVSVDPVDWTSTVQLDS